MKLGDLLEIRSGLVLSRKQSKERTPYLYSILTLRAVSYTHLDVYKRQGLAQLYVQDGRFTAYYDREVPGCARFLCGAVCRWAGQD